MGFHPAGRRRMEKKAAAVFGCFLAIALFVGGRTAPVSPAEQRAPDARAIMEEAIRRHEAFPYVFEEQTLILIDRNGRRDIREIRRFSRIGKDGSIRFLLVFDNPPEIRGTALTAVQDADGRRDVRIYLPALGMRLVTLRGEGKDFLGTDFAVGDLVPERLSDHRYERREDGKVGEIDCFVIDALPVPGATAGSSGTGMRRHFIRKDIFFVVRTEYHDRGGRLLKTQNRYDLKRLGPEMWRPDMILMKNHQRSHETLLKIHRRVYSQAYVPPEIFAPEWLLHNRHVSWPDRTLLRKGPDTGGEPAGPVPPDGPSASGNGRPPGRPDREVEP